MWCSRLTIAVGLLAAFSATTFAADETWTRVGQALGKPGSGAGGVYRVGLPRTDLKVTLDGVESKPGICARRLARLPEDGRPGHGHGRSRADRGRGQPGDAKLEQGGIEITALHNHLLRDQPFTMYMHVHGHGDPVKLAAALHDGLARKQDAVRRRAPRATPARRRRSISTPPRIDQPSVPRAATTAASTVQHPPRGDRSRMAEWRCRPPMGSAIAINFQPTGGGKAAITGDFVLIGKEVDPVIKALRENGIEVTALHNHMLDEQPRLFFMHFWANDDAQKLATGLRAALDRGQDCEELNVLRTGDRLLHNACDAGGRRRAAQTAGAPPLVLEAKIPLGDVSGRIDHLAIDVDAAAAVRCRARQQQPRHRRSRGRQGAAPDRRLSEPQGVAYVPFADTVYVANAGDGSVRLLRADISRRSAASSLATMPTTCGSTRSATACSWVTARARWQ